MNSEVLERSPGDRTTQWQTQVQAGDHDIDIKYRYSSARSVTHVLRLCAVADTICRGEFVKVKDLNVDTPSNAINTS